MQRRRFVQQLGTGFVTALGLGITSMWQKAQAQSASVRVQWLGHTCFVFEGDGRRILVNPFRAIGCTAGYAVPAVASDVVLISSRLFDEGGTLEGLPGNPPILAERGEYELPPVQMKSIEVDHDGDGGRRFGKNLIWRWRQGGLTFVHMGGAAAAISVEAQIQLGRPDVMLVPVGGGPKAYDAEDAIAAGAGVCQDHTHIFLACARRMGVPARYVSGYLMLDDRIAQEAMHAWAEGYIEGLGWVGFDVSNGISPDTRYVRVATGLDYHDAAPVSGRRIGGAGEKLEVAIDVTQQ